MTTDERLNNLYFRTDENGISYLHRRDVDWLLAKLRAAVEVVEVVRRDENNFKLHSQQLCHNCKLIKNFDEAGEGK